MESKETRLPAIQYPPSRCSTYSLAIVSSSQDSSKAILLQPKGARDCEMWSHIWNSSWAKHEIYKTVHLRQLFNRTVLKRERHSPSKCLSIFSPQTRR